MMEPQSAHETPASPLQGWAVEAARVRIWRDAFCSLHVSVDGTDHADLRPRRVFPVSGRSPYVSFMNEKAEEVVLLTDPVGLDTESAAALALALARVYHGAIISRVYDITETMGVGLWTVMTDRGYASFEVVDRERHIRLLPNGRYLITDVDGNRFEIPCVFDLDERSQRLIETET
jgi:hypothetical protein